MTPNQAISCGCLFARFSVPRTTPVGIQIANIVMPTPEQQEERRRAHYALDEITRLLHKPEPLTPKEELMIRAQLYALKATQHVD